MAPPESAVEGFGYGDPKRDIDRSNYVRKTDEYVRRAEAYKLQPRVPDFEKLRCGRDSVLDSQNVFPDDQIVSTGLQCRRRSGPQGKVEPLTIIDDPADWRAADLKVGNSPGMTSLTQVRVLAAAHVQHSRVYASCLWAHV